MQFSRSAYRRGRYVWSLLTEIPRWGLEFPEETPIRMRSIRTPSRLNSVSDLMLRSGLPVRSHPKVQPSDSPALSAGSNNQ